MGRWNDRHDNDGDDTIIGGRRSEYLFGGDGNDLIQGNGGNDRIFGGDGDDALFGGSGNDRLFGGEGDDSIDGGEGCDVVDAGNGNDTINAGDHSDWVAAGDGDDSVDAGSGNDIVYGGAGNDTINGGAGNDLLFGGSGNDEISGGVGYDRIYAGSGNDAVDGGANNDTVYGGSGDDTIDGGDANDVLIGEHGNDRVSGDAGYDRIYGGDGADTLSGGSERDTIYGGDDGDDIQGGGGSDILVGDDGNDQISGDAGNDRLYGGDGDDTVQGGEGRDTVYSGRGDDSVEGGSDSDVLITDRGNDSVSGGGGDDRIYAGRDDDVVSGGEGNDTIYAGSGDDSVDGGAGNDFIAGKGGDDTLVGGAGNDDIRGDRDDDVIFGDGGDFADVTDPNELARNSAGTFDVAGLDTVVFTVDFLGESAGYDNSFGFYLADASGDPIGGRIIFAEVDRADDDAGEGVRTITLDSDDLAGAASLGFFLIPDGDDRNRKLRDGDDITFQQNGDGEWLGFDNGRLIRSAEDRDAIFFSDPALNRDGLDHEVDNALPGNSAWEDLLGGGDNDFNDARFDIHVFDGEFPAFNDTIRANKGDDFVNGDRGDDVIDGGKGNDTLQGGSGDDHVDGDKDEDELIYNARDNQGDSDFYDGGKGTDTLNLELTQNEAAALAGEISDFQDFLADNGNPNKQNGPAFEFDGIGLTARNFEALTITIVNTNPDAVDDDVTTDEDTAVLINVLANDTDAEGDTLTVTAVTQPASGTAQIVGNQILYTPAADFNGTDSFTYTIFDGVDGFDTATVNITVNAVNDAPVAVDDTATVTEDTTDNVIDVLANDSDIDGDPLTVVSASALHGTVTINGDNTISYTSDPNYHGPDTITYTISDGELTDTAEVAVTVLNDNADSLFTPGDDVVDFNTITPFDYDDGNTTDALGGNDLVILPTNQAEADEAGFDTGAAFNGGDGNDTIIGGDLDDTIQGGAGDDSLDGGQGDDLHSGGDGDDTILASDGADGIFGGAGVDTADFSSDTDGVTVDLDAGTGSGGLADGDTFADIEVVIGGSGDDNIAGEAGSNTLTGGAGNDSLAGGAGSDILDGGDGDDTIDGGEDNDFITGNQGSDSVSGGAGNDLVFGGDDDDTVEGGDGNDIIGGDDGNDSLSGGEGDDALVGGQGNDTADGGAGNDSLAGGAGSDILDGGDGDDTIDGGEDNDFITGNQGSDSVSGGAGNDLVFGGDDDDTVEGGDGNDSLSGGEGDDALVGGQGNDTADGGAGNDSLAGGAGSDFLDGGDGDDTIDGGEDNDFITGNQGSDSVSGGAGNDLVFGGDDDDTVEGGDGNDILGGDDGNDSLSGGEGDDALVGGQGNDTADGGAGNDSLAGGAGSDILDGGDGDDTIDGGEDNDFITGNQGSDSVSGGAGNDLVFGGDDDDTVEGGDGNDILGGDDGNDSLSGGEGDDALVGGQGNDTADGGAGNDSLAGGAGDDLAFGGDGADTISGDAGNDALDGGAGDDSIDGGDGDDGILGGAGNDTILGGEGSDSVESGSGDDSVDGGAGNDFLGSDSGANTIQGGAGDDVIGGGSDADQIFGGDDNDLILANGGDDTVDGGTGDDSVRGDAGNDVITGGEGNDTLRGDAGNDLVDGGLDDDSLDGGTGDDTLLGGEGDDVLDGGGDDDSLDGGNGNDAIDGGEGNDTVAAGAGDDVVDAGAGDDSVEGGDGNDAVNGGDGNDTLNGGAGNDTLLGGEGDDEFTSGPGDDSINGGAGDDNVTFSGDSGDFDVTFNGDGTVTIVDNTPGGFGTTTLEDVETVTFDDGVFNADGTNNTPEAVDDTATTDEDVAVNIDVAANDIDFDSDPLAAIAASADNGSVVVEADGTITYTGNQDFNGTDTITYTVSDGRGDTDTGTVDVTVNAVNDAPVITVPTGSAMRFNGNPANHVQVAHDPALSPDSWTVEAWVTTSDADGQFNRVVTKPVGGGQTYSLVVRNGEAHIRFDKVGGGAQVVQSGFVADGEPHHIAGTYDTATNTLSLYVDGVLAGSIIAAGDPIQGTEELNIGRFNDGFGQGFVGDVSEVRVWSEARDATQIADNFDQIIDASTEPNLELYMTFDPTFAEPGVVQDLSGRDLDGTVVGSPQIVPGGAPVDQAIQTEVGTEVRFFGGAVADADLDEGTGQIQVTVEAVNGTIDVSSGTGATISGDQSKTVTITGTLAQVSASLSNMTFTPDAGFIGTETVTITANDLGNTGAGGPLTDVQTFTILVIEPNVAPEAADDAATVDEDGTVLIDVLANDADDNGDALTITNATVPANGTAVIEGNQIRYTPDPDFNGTDSFTYTIDDGKGETDTATVSVTIDPVNDDPIILFGGTDTTGNVVEDSADPLTADGTVAFLDVDAGDTHTVNVGFTGATGDLGGISAAQAEGFFSAVINGSAADWSFSADNALFDHLDCDEQLVLGYSVEIDDGNGGTAVQNITITVDGTNDLPRVSGPVDGGTTNEDAAPATVDLLANASDAEGADLATTDVAVASSNAGRVVAFTVDDATGQLTVDPAQFNDLAAGETETLTITYGVIEEDRALSDTLGAQTVPNNGGYYVFDFDTGDVRFEFNVPIPGNAFPGPVNPPVNGVVFGMNPNNSNFGVFVSSFLEGVETVRPGSEQSIADYAGAFTVGATSVSYQDATNGADLTWSATLDDGCGPRDISITLSDLSFTDAFPGNLGVGAVSATADPQATPATATLVIEGVNDRQEVSGAVDAGSVTEDDAPVTIDLLANASDPDGDDLDVANVAVSSSNAARNVVTSVDAETGEMTIDPAQFNDLAVGESETVTVTYDVTDDTADFTDTIGSPNVPNPGVTYVIDFDTGNTFTFVRSGGPFLPANLEPENGAFLHLNPNNGFGGGLQAQTFLNGVATIRDESEFDFGDYSGTATGATFSGAFSGDTITWTAHTVDTPDGEQCVSIRLDNVSHFAIDQISVGSATFDVTTDVAATATIEITGVNDDPTANDDAFATTEGGLVLGDLLANDSDVDGDALSIQDVNGEAPSTAFTVTSVGGNQGVVVFSETGANNFAFDPAGGFESLGAGVTDTVNLIYTVSDGNGGTDTASIAITITGENDDVVIDAGASDLSSDLTAGFVRADSLDANDLLALFNDVSRTATVIDEGGLDVLHISAGGQTRVPFIEIPVIAAGEISADTRVTVLLDGVIQRVGGDQDMMFGVADSDQHMSLFTVDGSIGGLFSDAILAGGSLGVAFPENPPVNDRTGLGFGQSVEDFTVQFLLEGSQDQTTLLEGDGSVLNLSGDPGAFLDTDDALSVVISGDQTHEFYEVVSLAFSFDVDGLIDSGSIVFNDADIGDTHIASVTNVATTGDTNGIAAATLAGFLTLGPVTSASGGTPGSVVWSFDADDALFDYLADGESLGIAYTIEVDDGQGSTDSEVVTITVNGRNEAPVAADDTFTTGESAFLTGDLLANDSDTDGDALSVQDVNGQAPLSAFTVTSVGGRTGQVIFDNTGANNFAFDAAGGFEDLAAGETDTVNLTYTVSDGNGGTDTASIAITITGENDSPVTADDTATVDEDTAVNIDVLTNDGDVEGDALTVTAASAANGQVVIESDGTLTYTPVGDFNGSDTISYTISDGNGGTDTAEVAVTVNAVNDAPVLTPPVAGAVRFDGNTANHVEIAHDDGLNSTSWTVETWVTTSDDDTPFNRILTKPVSGGQTYSLVVNNGEAHIRFDDATLGQQFVQAGFVADGQPHHIAGVFDDAANTLSLYVDGVLTGSITTTGTPLLGNEDIQIGQFSNNFASFGFDGEISEVRIWSEARTAADIAADLNGVLDPVAEDGLEVYMTFSRMFTGFDEGSVQGANTIQDLSGNDRDGQIFGFLQFVSGDAPVDSAIVTEIGQEVRFLDLSVLDVDAAEGTNQIQVVLETTDGIIDTQTFPGFTQIGDRTGQVTLIGDPATLTDSLDFSTFKPNPGFSGTATITVTATDLGNTGAGGPQTTVMTFTVEVIDPNAAPVAVDDTATVDEDSSVNIDVLANDSDPDANDVLTVTAASASDGTVVIEADGTLTYTPTPDFFGSDTITYTVEDGRGGSDTGEVAVTVIDTPDGPVVTNDTGFTGTENVPVLLDVLANDTGNDLRIVSAEAASGAPVSFTGNIGDGITLDPTGGNTAGLGFGRTLSFDGLAPGDTIADIITFVVEDANGDQAGDAVVTRKTLDLSQIGSTTTASLDLDGVTVTGSANVQSLNFNGLGIQGGPFTARLDAGETMRLDFDHLAANVLFQVGTVNNTTGINGVQVLVEGFDADGVSLGTQTVTANFTELGGHISAAFGDVPLSRVDITGQGDAFIMRTLNFDEIQGDGFAIVTVSGVNDAPVIVDQTFSVAEDSFGLFETLDLDDPDRNHSEFDLTLDLVSAPAGATANLDFGELDFRLNGQFQDVSLGEVRDVFVTYTATDPDGAISNVGAITIQISGNNDPVTAQDDLASVDEDSSVLIDVLANDSDVDALDVVSIQSVGVASNGTVTIEGGQIRYTPNANFNGLDGFTYVATDGNGETDVAIVSVTVNQDNADFVFTAGNDTVDLNTVVAADADDGNVSDAGDGNDVVTLANDAAEAAEAGFIVGQTFVGGAGDDTITGGGLDDVIDGSAGNDNLSGGNGSDTLQGGDGFDTLNGGDGTDFISAGAGDDLIIGSEGFDQILGETGNDQIDYSGLGSAITANLNTGSVSSASFIQTLLDVEEIVGTQFDDDIEGHIVFANVIAPGAGNDTVFGNGTNDTIDYSTESGGVFVDLANNLAIDGSGGTDQIFSFTNAIGGQGDDTFLGTAGNNSLDGGDGLDQLDFSGETALVTVDLSAGTASGTSIGADTVTNFEAVVGTAFNDTLTGGTEDNAFIGAAGDDLIQGGAGADTVSGGIGNDILDGGTGFDTADYSAAGSGIIANFAAAIVVDGDGGVDSVASIEAVIGSGFDDQINTGDDMTTVFAGGGNDLITHDTFVFGVTVSGGTGNDTVSGTFGADRFVFQTGDGVDQVGAFQAGAGVQDILDFSGNAAITGIGDLNINDDGLGNTSIGYGAGDSITLLGVNSGDLDADDFQF